MKNVKTIGLGFLMMLGLSLVSAQCGSEPAVNIEPEIEVPTDTTQTDVPTDPDNTESTDVDLPAEDETETTELDEEAEL